MIYCFDLDDTICFPNHEFNDTIKKYKLAQPNFPVIEAINKLKENNKIIIFTARRMLTFDGDIDRIKEDVEEITIEWLKIYSVKYDELIFGKPFADVYVDDKNLYIEHLIKENI